MIVRLAFLSAPYAASRGGLLKFPRRWLRVKRNGALGELKWHLATRPAVATCRQTVEALLAPLSTAWQRMATARSGWLRLGSGWLDLARYFRNTSPKVVCGR